VKYCTILTANQFAGFTSKQAQCKADFMRRDATIAQDSAIGRCLTPEGRALGMGASHILLLIVAASHLAALALSL